MALTDDCVLRVARGVLSVGAALHTAACTIDQHQRIVIPTCDVPPPYNWRRDTLGPSSSRSPHATSLLVAIMTMRQSARQSPVGQHRIVEGTVRLEGKDSPLVNRS